MKNLNLLASRLFKRYSFSKLGYEADWRYLSRARQLEWMQDVIEVYNVVIDSVEEELKAEVVENKYAASFEKGFNAGVKAENHRLINKAKRIRDNLNEQLEKMLKVEQNEDVNNK